MAITAQEAKSLDSFTAVVRKPFEAHWDSGSGEFNTKYRAGEKIRCASWRPEGMSVCRASGHPDMWLSWKDLQNCDIAGGYNSCAINAKFKVGDEVRYRHPNWGPCTGYFLKEENGNLVLADDKGGPAKYHIPEHWVINSCAINGAPSGLTPSSKLRLKEDFKDDFGSYKKGQVFPMYQGGINPVKGTMTVPGRSCTLQIPWDKLEVVNTAINSTRPIVQMALNRVACNDNPKYAQLERDLLSAIRGGNEAKIKAMDAKIRAMGCEWVAQKKNGLLVDNISWIVNDAKQSGDNPYTGVRITDKGQLWNSAAGMVAKNGKDKTIGGTEIYDHGDGSISYVLGWRGNEGAISGSGTKERVIAKAKVDIATLKSKVVEMEKVLAYLQSM